MRILIIGAGLGGLALAAFLKETKVEYEIIERAKDSQHQGYAVCIWRNGRDILNKLGLGEEFDTHSTPANDYRIFNGKGKLLKFYGLKSFYDKYGMAFNLVLRSDLHNWLMRYVDSLKVIMGTQVERITQNNEGVSVKLSSGEEKHYDAVIGADGINSQVRTLVFNPPPIKKSPWRVWYMWVNNTYKTKSSVVEYVEKNEVFSFFDVGEKTFAVIAAPDATPYKMEGTVEHMKKMFPNTVLSPKMFEGLKDEEVVSSEMFHIDLPSWSKGRVVLIGDAAHGFEPYAGVGGSMALEDGYVLAQELSKVSNDYSLEDAYSSFEEKRRNRVRTAKRITDKMKSWALIQNPVSRFVLDIVAPYVPESYFVRDYKKLMDERV